MSAPESVHAPTLGQHGEPCPRCGAPLAADQRYCLECGTRRAEARLPFLDVLRHRADAAAPAPPDRRPRWTESITGGTAALGVALAVLFLAVGVLVGRSGGGKTSAAAPSVVTVGSGSGSTAAASTGAAQAKFTSDWPAGQSGWTVELQALAKSGTDPSKVASAKSAAQSKGAPAVGVLDSDGFGSLTPGQYVVYSGRFKSKAEATKALGKLRKSFPQAKVVQVSAAGAGGAGPVINSAKAQQDKQKLQQLQNLSGSDYSKQSRKLPKTVELPGKAPAKDNKPAGGGSGFQSIG
jgi:hypothetical protein